MVSYVLRKRSPRHPKFGFSAAAEHGRKIFLIAELLPLSKINVAHILGYGSMNGSSLSILASLRYYGLIENDVDGKIRISDPAAKMYRLAESDPERTQIIKSLASRPAIFKKVMDLYPDGLPSDQALSDKLESEFGFTLKAIPAFIKSLKQTIKILKKSDADPIKPPPEEVFGILPTLDVRPPSDVRPASVEPPHTEPAAVPESFAEEWRWRLPGGELAVLHLTKKLNKKRGERLKQLISFLVDDSVEEEDSVSG